MVHRHSSQAGNFAIKNLVANRDIYFELAGSVEPLRLTSTGATFAGNIVVSGTVDGVDIAARDAVLTVYYYNCGCGTANKLVVL